MGIKDSVKNLIEKVKDKYDDYQERKSIEAEEEAERRRLNTPIMDIDCVYKPEIDRTDISEEYRNHGECYMLTNLMMHAGIYPEKFQLRLYEEIETHGAPMFEDDYGRRYAAWGSDELLEIEYGKSTYYNFSQFGERLLSPEEEDMVMFALRKLEESYYVTYIISNLEPYFVFSRRVTNFLDGCLSTYCQEKYAKYKASMSHEEAKGKAINDVKPYKDILNRKSKEYEDKYQIFLNKQREQQIKKQNEQKDLFDSYRSL
ncbi:MAG: hypothetical protein ACI4T2_02600 [Christensenellales bacterium]